MWRLGVAMITATGLAMATLAADAPHALACSRGPFEPLVEGDVIVEGRYVQYSTAPRPAATEVYADPKTEADESFEVPAGVTETLVLDVSQVFKGAAAPKVTIVQEAVLEPVPIGGCYRIASDPTGQYTIVALNSRGDGTYSYQYHVFSGGALSGEAFERSVAGLKAVLGPPYLPELGSGPDASPPVTRTLVGVAAGGLALTLLGFAAGIRSKR